MWVSWEMADVLANGEGDVVRGSGVLDVDLEVGEEHQRLASILAIIDVVVHASEWISYIIFIACHKT